MIRRKPVSVGADRIFLKKAGEFAKGMKNELGLLNYDSAAVLSVHCVISCCDAITSFYLKCRNASERHLDVIHLLREIPDIKAELTSKEKQISRVISLKTDAEYSDRIVKKDEAKEAVRTADKILGWAKKLL